PTTTYARPGPLTRAWKTASTTTNTKTGRSWRTRARPGTRATTRTSTAAARYAETPTGVAANTDPIPAAHSAASFTPAGTRWTREVPGWKSPIVGALTAGPGSSDRDRSRPPRRAARRGRSDRPRRPAPGRSRRAGRGGG